MSFFEIDGKTAALAEKALEKCRGVFAQIDRTTEYNQQKVLSAFINNGVTESMFAASSGYGYGDRGRETLDRVVAEAFGAEDALMRSSFASGTATLTTALFALLRPGDTMLSVTGTPYDTIRPVIGITGEGDIGSLRDFGINYREVQLTSEGKPDFPSIKKAIAEYKPKMVYIQRSRGYTLRPSLTAKQVGDICDFVHELCGAYVMVDNCYGEFVCREEPAQLGADIIAGSLIKNPGGGIARSGGYIAGKHALVEQCAYRMTAPGVGREVGATLGMTRELFLGFFSSPHVVGEALKTAVFASSLFEEAGFAVTPTPLEERGDIIQTILLENEKRLIGFCQGLQKGSPVDSFAVPEPWDMPGYDSKVIMAAGAFTLGSSIELSADAPLREPYAVWMQGGLNFHSAKVGIMLALQNIE